MITGYQDEVVQTLSIPSVFSLPSVATFIIHPYRFFLWQSVPYELVTKLIFLGETV